MKLQGQVVVECQGQPERVEARTKIACGGRGPDPDTREQTHFGGFVRFLNLNVIGVSGSLRP